MGITLYGYKYSLYTWIACACLHEKQTEYEYREIDPFAEDIPPDYLTLNSFGNVPTLDHDGFVLFETRAITQYLNETCVPGGLQQQSCKERAKSSQIISILDAYGYWPMVRQVYANRVFAPAFGETVDEHEILKGLEKSELVLGALEQIVCEVQLQEKEQFLLSDLHLVPMISFFSESGEGAEILKEFPALNERWRRLRDRPCFVETRQELPRY